MQLHVFALLGLIASQSASAQAAIRTQAGQWTYEVKARSLTKVDRFSQKVVWSKTYAFENMRLIDVEEDALVIVGMESKKHGSCGVPGS